MTKRTAQEYQRASPKDQREFDSWLNSNAILSSIFAVGMLVMALAGFGTVASDQSAKRVITIAPTSAGGVLVEPVSFTSTSTKINQ